MALKKIEIKVGLVVVVATLILFFSLLWVKDFRLNHDRYELTIIFPTVGGLTSGDPVYVAGVQTGQVQQIVLRANDVLVAISLDGTVSLSAGSRFSIQSMGLMGEKFVSIEPGQGTEPIDPGEVIDGHYRGGMSEVMGQVEELLLLVKGSAGTLQETIGNPEARTSIKESLENIRKFSQDLATLMDDEGGDLAGALKDLRSASRGFRELVETNQGRLDSTFDRFNSASTNLDRLTGQLSEISVTFEDVAEKIERGEGTLGALVQDETLYRDLKETVQHLDELILDIQEHPHRYLRLEIF